MEHITDYETRAPEQLIERYRKPAILAVLRSWLSELQEVEDALWQLLNERAIHNAVGLQLDTLGKILGQPREGRADELYRVWLKARVLVLRSSGQTEQLIAIAKRIVGADVRIYLEEYYPLAMMMRAESPLDPQLGVQIAKFLAAAKGGGVALYFEWLGAGPTQPFTLGETPEYDSPFGLDQGVLSAVSNGNEVTFATSVAPHDALLHEEDGEPLVYDADGDYLLLG